MSFQDTLRSFHKQTNKDLQLSNTPRRTNLDFNDQIENIKNKKENANLSDILHEEEQTEKEIANVVDRLKIMLNSTGANSQEQPVKTGIVAKIATDKPRKPKKPNIII